MTDCAQCGEKYGQHYTCSKCGKEFCYECGEFCETGLSFYCEDCGGLTEYEGVVTLCPSCLVEAEHQHKKIEVEMQISEGSA